MQPGTLREKLFGATKTLRDKLAESIVGKYEVENLPDNHLRIEQKPNIIERIKGQKPTEQVIKADELKPYINEKPEPITDTYEFTPGKIEEPKKTNLLRRAKAKITDLLDGDNQAATASMADQTPAIEEPKVEEVIPPVEERIKPTETIPPQKIDKTKLVFQESTVGNGLPYLETDEGTTSIDKVAKNLEVPPLEKPIKRIVITDPQEGQYVIDTPEKLAIANEIKAIADAIAPEYTNYLLKLAQKEGGYDRAALRPEDQNPGGGNDRGIFQINSKFFPTVTDEMAKDIRFSVLWALSLIESGDPKKGDGMRTGQEKWIADPAVRRSTIEIE